MTDQNNFLLDNCLFHLIVSIQNCITVFGGVETGEPIFDLN